MNNPKVKWRRDRTTDAEILLKRKHDATKALLSQMNQKQFSDAEQERSIAQQRKMAHMAALQLQHRNKSNSSRGSRELSQEVDFHGEVQSNINVTINVNTSIKTVNRRKHQVKKGKLNESAKQTRNVEELMNSSLSQMLDRQLLANNQQAAHDGTRKVKNNVEVAQSLTKKIFHGDKLYLENGAMAFKPLAIETVLETDGASKNGFKAQFSKNGLAARTTEQNIALQQRLDFASVEDFISRQKLLNFLVSEEDAPQNQQEQASADQAFNGGVLHQAQISHQLGRLAKAPMQPELSTKAASKSSLKIAQGSPIKKAQVVEESRQVHQGLQKMELLFKSQTQAEATPQVTDVMTINSGSLQPEHQPVVRFDKQALSKFANSHQQVQLSKESSLTSPSKDIYTGGRSVDGSKSPKQIGHALYRQLTGNDRQVSRTMRKDRSNEETGQPKESEKLSIDTVLVQLPKPNRLRSNATFQPQSSDPIIDQTLKALESGKAAAMVQERASETGQKTGSLHDDNLSQLAIDYNLHLKNKQRIQSLMALLQKGDQKASSQLSLNTQPDVSVSNYDDAASRSTHTKQIKLPSINARQQEQESMADEPVSTEVGSYSRPSVKNLAEYRRQRHWRESPKKREPPSGIFESSIDGQSVSQERSVLDRLNQGVIQDHEDGGRSRLQTVGKHEDSPSHRIQRIQRMSMNSLSNIHLIGRDVELGSKYGSLEPIRNSRRELAELSADYRRKLVQPNMRLSKKQKSKFSMVRSSMFNKNPIFDQMDIQMLNSREGGSSEYSVGPRSQMNHHHPNPTTDQLESYQDDKQYHSAARSVKTLNVRSLSSKRLKPINYHSQAQVNEVSAPQSQSLQFNQGLSFVMVKGKVQPSEKYIYKMMLPYTAAQKYTSMSIKSSLNRHFLILQQQAPTSIPTRTKETASKEKGKAKRKRLKSSKTKRRDSENLKSADANALSQIRASRGKKGVIMEMSIEDENSERNSSSETRLVNVAGTDEPTWTEMRDENEQLKQQILTQIAIFEQYLKVAVLQRKALLQEEREEVQRFGIKLPRDEIFQGAKDFEFDDIRQKNEYLKAVAKKSKGKSRARTKPSKKSTTIAKEAARPVDKRASPMQRSKVSRQSSDSTLLRSPAQGKQVTSGQKSALKTNQSDDESDQGSIRKIVTKQGEVKATFKYLNKGVTQFKMRALEHLMPTSGEKSMPTHLTAHTAHQLYISKIQRIWEQLNRLRNPEVVAVQNEIKRNKRRINELMRENLFELDVNSHEQRIVLEVKTQHTQINRKVQRDPEAKKVRKLQMRIRDELARKQEFDTWGFHNHIIEYRLKIRMQEDLIDCAQRLKVKPDARTEKELRLLKILRDRTYDDINYFVQKREEKRWRLWDRYGGRMYKPSIENRDLTLAQLQERIDTHLAILAYIEPRYAQLVNQIPPYNTINAEMIQFATFIFGNEGWLQVFQLRQLRKQQEQEQHEKEYMPPVDHIKKLEVDPYTLQVDSVVLLDQAHEAPPLVVGSSEEKKEFKSWWVRKPDQLEQAKLKTGYEPLIAQKNKQNVAIEEVDESLDRQSSLGSLRGSVDGSRAKPSERKTSVPQTHEKRDQQQHLGEPKGSGRTDNGDTVGGPLFTGDIVESLKALGSHMIMQEKKLQEADQIKRKSWLQQLELEKQMKAEREQRERRARAARLAVLFEEEDLLSQDDEDFLDAGAVKHDAQDFMDKIVTHLHVEKKILEAWQENDGIGEGGTQAP